MDHYIIEKTFVTFFSIIIGAIGVFVAGMLLFTLYNLAPTSLYIIGGLVVLWLMCFLWVWYKDKEYYKK